MSEIRKPAGAGYFMVADGLSTWAHLKAVNMTKFYLSDIYNSKDVQVMCKIMVFSLAFIMSRSDIFLVRAYFFIPSYRESFSKKIAF